MKDNEKLKNENIKLEEDIKSLTNSARLQIDLKKKALEEQSQVVVNLKDNHAKLSMRYESLKCKYENKSSAFEDLDTKYAELKTLNKNIQVDNEEMNLKNETLQMEFTHLQKKYEDMKNNYEKEKRKVADHEKKDITIQKALAETQGALDLKNEWLHEVEVKYMKAEEENKNYLDQINALKMHLKVIENNCISICQIQDGGGTPVKYNEHIDPIVTSTDENTNESIIRMLYIKLLLREIHNKAKLCKMNSQFDGKTMTLAEQQMRLESLSCQLDDVAEKNNKLSKDFAVCNTAVESCQSQINNNACRISELVKHSELNHSSNTKGKKSNSIDHSMSPKIGSNGDGISFLSESISEADESNSKIGSP